MMYSNLGAGLIGFPEAYLKTCITGLINATIAFAHNQLTVLRLPISLDFYILGLDESKLICARTRICMYIQRGMSASLPFEMGG